MNHLTLFKIPYWLPNILPPELWCIIFFWKWKIEFKNIHEHLLKIPKCYKPTLTLYYNNIYNKFNLIHDLSLYYRIVIEKSGIELLHWYNGVTPFCQDYRVNGIYVFKNNNNLRSHIKTNMGLECPEYFSRNTMIKLLRSV